MAKAAATLRPLRTSRSAPRSTSRTPTVSRTPPRRFRMPRSSRPDRLSTFRRQCSTELRFQEDSPAARSKRDRLRRRSRSIAPAPISSAASSTMAHRCARRSLRNSVAAAALAVLFVVLASAPASAIPIFAQRYHLRCGQCHSVLPELNAFGNYFRNHGYRLPLPEHGTTVFAIRYQMEYDQHPAAGSRQWQGGGIVLGSANFGPITTFLHYSLGAAGGPSATYLFFAAGYNEHTKTLFRGGLFELPLTQSPGQRLDDLEQYGYYGAHVGLNNLPLSSPRWGLMAEKTIGNLRVDGVVALSSFQGAPYGGKPVATGETTWNSSPEFSIWLRQTLAQSNKSLF